MDGRRWSGLAAHPPQERFETVEADDLAWELGEGERAPDQEVQRGSVGVGVDAEGAEDAQLLQDHDIRAHTRRVDRAPGAGHHDRAPGCGQLERLGEGSWGVGGHVDDHVGQPAGDARRIAVTGSSTSTSTTRSAPKADAQREPVAVSFAAAGHHHEPGSGRLGRGGDREAAHAGAEHDDAVAELRSPAG